MLKRLLKNVREHQVKKQQSPITKNYINVRQNCFKSKHI